MLGRVEALDEANGPDFGQNSTTFRLNIVTTFGQNSILHTKDRRRGFADLSAYGYEPSLEGSKCVRSPQNHLRSERM